MSTPNSSIDFTVSSVNSLLNITVAAGPTGPQGPPGSSSGGDLNYVYIQSIPASVWNITHNLNKYPSVTVIDSAGDTVIGALVYNSPNSLTVTFVGGFSGKAYLN